MEIIILDIPPEGLTLDFDASRDEWFRRLLMDSLGDVFEEGDRATLDIRLERLDEDVDLKGTLTLVSHPTCDRCLERYREEMIIPLKTHLAPLYENERQREREMEEGVEVELVKEDLDFSYYEGDRIHLDEVISEQLVLAQPMKHLCSENCKGLCQRCGKNLNEGPCSCREEHIDHRWDALKKFKVASK